ncbi:uncharacterized protein LOC125039707 [Penaeus chinensis]|uniref:uncharacterized protein LOC125039707 n=1 Tax=Penaeus chinensis TaxID=139456 RepID=UPI001FB73AC4|nr:uncharacterized protein LOC125039707 [Penaeus chinensis]
MWALLVGVMCVGVVAGLPPASVPYETCDPTLTPSECQLRRAECGVINSIMQPAGGPIVSVVRCSQVVGVAINPAVFSTLGTSFLAGVPPSLPDYLQADPTSLAALRFCVLNSTGLLLPDGKIDRPQLLAKLDAQLYYVPTVAATVKNAVKTCPEPQVFKVQPFIACLRSACLTAPVPLPLSAAEVNPPSLDLTLASLPTSMPLPGYWAF